MMSGPVVAARGVSVKFGEHAVLRDVSFSIEAGEICAVIGPNGAGKTTLLNALSGHVSHSGTIQVRGVEVGQAFPQRLYDLGVARTFQVARAFSSLTVNECVAAALARRERWHLMARPRFSGVVAEAVASVGLSDQCDRVVATLPYADVKRVDLAIALASRPDLLLLDEPAAGVGLEEREQLLGAVEKMCRDSGLAVLFAEHDVDLVFKYARRIIVLHQGGLIKEGDPDSVRADPVVTRVYLGDDVLV